MAPKPARAAAVAPAASKPEQHVDFSAATSTGAAATGITQPAAGAPEDADAAEAAAALWKRAQHSVAAHLEHKDMMVGKAQRGTLSSLPEPAAKFDPNKKRIKVTTEVYGRIQRASMDLKEVQNAYRGSLDLPACGSPASPLGRKKQDDWGNFGLLAKLRPTTTPNMQLALPEEPAEEEFDEWAESPKEGWADIVRVRRAARTQEARRREAAACMIQANWRLHKHRQHKQEEADIAAAAALALEAATSAQDALMSGLGRLSEDGEEEDDEDNSAAKGGAATQAQGFKFATDELAERRARRAARKLRQAAAARGIVHPAERAVAGDVPQPADPTAGAEGDDATQGVEMGTTREGLASTLQRGKAGGPRKTASRSNLAAGATPSKQQLQLPASQELGRQSSGFTASRARSRSLLVTAPHVGASLGDGVTGDTTQAPGNGDTAADTEGLAQTAPPAFFARRKSSIVNLTFQSPLDAGGKHSRDSSPEPPAAAPAGRDTAAAGHSVPDPGSSMAQTPAASAVPMKGQRRSWLFGWGATASEGLVQTPLAVHAPGPISAAAAAAGAGALVQPAKPAEAVGSSVPASTVAKAPGAGITAAESTSRQQTSRLLTQDTTSGPAQAQQVAMGSDRQAIESRHQLDQAEQGQPHRPEQHHHQSVLQKVSQSGFGQLMQRTVGALFGSSSGGARHGSISGSGGTHKSSTRCSSDGRAVASSGAPPDDNPWTVSTAATPSLSADNGRSACKQGTNGAGRSNRQEAPDSGRLHAVAQQDVSVEDAPLLLPVSRFSSCGGQKEEQEGRHVQNQHSSSLHSHPFDDFNTSSAAPTATEGATDRKGSWYGAVWTSLSGAAAKLLGGGGGGGGDKMAAAYASGLYSIPTTVRKAPPVGQQEGRLEDTQCHSHPLVAVPEPLVAQLAGAAGSGQRGDSSSALSGLANNGDAAVERVAPGAALAAREGAVALAPAAATAPATAAVAAAAATLAKGPRKGATSAPLLTPLRPAAAGGLGVAAGGGSPRPASCSDPTAVKSLGPQAAPQSTGVSSSNSSRVALSAKPGAAPGPAQAAAGAGALQEGDKEQGPEEGGSPVLKLAHGVALRQPLQQDIPLKVKGSSSSPPAVLRPTMAAARKGAGPVVAAASGSVVVVDPSTAASAVVPLSARANRSASPQPLAAVAPPGQQKQQQKQQQQQEEASPSLDRLLEQQRLLAAAAAGPKQAHGTKPAPPQHQQKQQQQEPSKVQAPGLNPVVRGPALTARQAPDTTGASSNETPRGPGQQLPSLLKGSAALLQVPGSLGVGLQQLVGGAPGAPAGKSSGLPAVKAQGQGQASAAKRSSRN